MSKKTKEWWVEYRKKRGDALKQWHREYEKRRYWEKKLEPKKEVSAVVVPKPMKMTKANHIVYKMGLCPYCKCSYRKPMRRVPFDEGEWEWMCNDCIDKKTINETKEHNQYEHE